MRILVVTDSYIPEEYFRKAFERVAKAHTVRFTTLDQLARPNPTTESEKAIREYTGDPKELAAKLKDEDALVVHTAPVTDEVMKASPNLKAVFCARGGPVNIDLESATRLNIAVVPSPGRNADAVADFAMALILTLARHVFTGYAFLKEGRQLTRETYGSFMGHELGGKVLGLVGYGNVGSRVAARAIAFGMSVLVYDPFVDKSRVEAPGISMSSLPDLLAASDFVSVHARESPENVDMIGKDQFNMMKKSANFINTARGSLVDEHALYDALTSGQIAGAALDVMKIEPFDPASPLLKLDNAVVTPHIAGASFEVRFRGAEIVGRQVERWIAGQPLDGVLNPQVLASKRT
jgi:D-3-phosphoglycerate dehydrogenase / 2-oxoglutarate reductase